jgi:hypothetical protein
LHALVVVIVKKSFLIKAIDQGIRGSVKDAQAAIHDGFHHREVGKDKILKLAIQNKKWS